MQFSVQIDADSPSDLTATIELLQQLHKLLVPEDHLRDSLVEILTLSSGQLLAPANFGPDPE